MNMSQKGNLQVLEKEKSPSQTHPSAGFLDWPEVSTLVDLLRYRGRHQSEQTGYLFLEDGERESASLTYQQLEQQARAIAARLQSQIAPGERVLLLHPPSLEFIAAFFGCLYAGAIAVPAYPPKRNQQKMNRLRVIKEDSQAKIALTTSAELARIETHLHQNPELAAIGWLATDSIVREQVGSWQEPDINPNTLALLQYTSGSTGHPKAVRVSHGNLLHNLALIHKYFENTPDCKGVSWLPPYHDMGLIGGILQPLFGGNLMILMPPEAFIQKPLRWLGAISRYQATTSGGPDFAYELAYHQTTADQRVGLDLSSWEVAFCGAEPVRAQTIEHFTATFAPHGFLREAFYPCYGMAETTLFVSGGLKTEPPVIRPVKPEALQQNRVVAVTAEEEGIQKLVSCGRSWSDQKIVIVDPESLTECQAEQVGEIWVSSPSVAQGYWNKPLQTEQTFRAYLAGTGEGPFLRTGDLGFFQDGELFITGRLKDVIIIQGRNYYPQEIELTVEQSHPALRPHSGAAFSLLIDGKEKLAIVQEIERSYLRKLNANQVIGEILQAVAQEHDLEVYALVLLKTASIPKTSSGKIQRSACRVKFLEGSLDVVADWSKNPENKNEFLHLKSEIESLFQQVQTTIYH